VLYIRAFIIFTIIEAIIGVYFYFTVSIYVLVIAVIGFLISFFYTAPPVKLKYIGGLGEPAVFIVWGPLMTVGSYYVVAGTMPLHVWLASIPFGLLVMNVLLCDHINKYEGDVKAGVKTLPVVIGLKNTLTLLKVTTTLFFVFITVFVASGILPVFSLLVYLAIPQYVQLVKIFSSTKPVMSKENEQIYHAWYIVWMFNFSKPAGGLFMAGLAIGAVPWNKLVNEIGIFIGG
jgi:1,4-dihydroxy-2-naphthoate octaprenyltransferase